MEQEGFRVETFTSFKKVFLFENWCKMMALAEEERVKLNDFMVASSVQVKQFFAIDVVEQQIESFQGEAALFVARKR